MFKFWRIFAFPTVGRVPVSCWCGMTCWRRRCHTRSARSPGATLVLFLKFTGCLRFGQVSRVVAFRFYCVSWEYSTGITGFFALVGAMDGRGCCMTALVWIVAVCTTGYGILLYFLLFCFHSYHYYYTTLRNNAMSVSTGASTNSCRWSTYRSKTRLRPHSLLITPLNTDML